VALKDRLLLKISSIHINFFTTDDSLIVNTLSSGALMVDV
jgi:hypothetical protein